MSYFNINRIYNHNPFILKDKMEPLADPDQDRAMKDIVPPPHRPLSEELLYPNKCKFPY